MTDDPDSSVPRPPQYLRTLMQGVIICSSTQQPSNVCLSNLSGLLASKDPQKMESSLKVAENMIRSEPSDLSEVLSRHGVMTASTILCLVQILRLTQVCCIRFIYPCLFRHQKRNSTIRLLCNAISVMYSVAWQPKFQSLFIS